MINTTRVFFSVLTVVAFGIVFSCEASAQDKKDDPLGSSVSSQCAQMSDPGTKADCVRLLRSDAQVALKQIQQYYDEQDQWQKWYEDMKKRAPKDK